MKQKKQPKKQSKRQPRQKKRHWPWLKALSVLMFALVLVFLWVLWVMDKEVRRLGIFTKESQGVQQVRPEASPQVEEIEKEEKKVLEGTLRERSKR